jgi:hypothetical protein
MPYFPMHATNHFPDAARTRAEWVAWEQANIARWVSEKDAQEPGSERAEYLRGVIHEHAYALMESERRRSADLAYQVHVAEHWSWGQELYADQRHVLDGAAKDRRVFKVNYRVGRFYGCSRTGLTVREAVTLSRQMANRADIDETWIAVTKPSRVVVLRAG